MHQIHIYKQTKSMIEQKGCAKTVLRVFDEACLLEDGVTIQGGGGSAASSSANKRVGAENKSKNTHTEEEGEKMHGEMLTRKVWT